MITQENHKSYNGIEKKGLHIDGVLVATIRKSNGNINMNPYHNFTTDELRQVIDYVDNLRGKREKINIDLEWR